jgi:glycine hydroxymethyltransferase
MVPGGLRMGSPALTSRGFLAGDFDKVAEFVDRAVQIAGAWRLAVVSQRRGAPGTAWLGAKQTAASCWPLLRALHAVRASLAVQGVSP